MSLADWRVFIAHTVTGEIVQEVEPIQQPGFVRKINDFGSVSVEVFLDQKHNRFIDFKEYTIPGKYSWIVAYGTYVMQAGPVWSSSFNESSKVLSVSCGGIQSIFNRRVLRNPEGHTSITDESEDVHYEDMTLWHIMAQIVIDNMAQPLSPDEGTGEDPPGPELEGFYQLPIDVPDFTGTDPDFPDDPPPDADNPPDDSGDADPATDKSGQDPATEINKSDHERLYYGYDLAMVGARLTDLSKVLKGPEFDFRPHFTADFSHVRWEMRIGTPHLGSDTIDLQWDYGSAMEAIDVDINGSASPIMRVWVKGSGQARDLITGFQANGAFARNGYPPLDFVDTQHTDVTEQDTLERYADADLVKFQSPLETWSTVVRIDGMSRHNRNVQISPRPGDFELGDSPIIFVDGHPWIASGGYRKRVVGIEADTSDTLKIDFEEFNSDTTLPDDADVDTTDHGDE